MAITPCDRKETYVCTLSGKYSDKSNYNYSKINQPLINDKCQLIGLSVRRDGNRCKFLRLNSSNNFISQLISSK